VASDTKQVVGAGKAHWTRPRPYQVDPILEHGDKDVDNSYPSGHSTQGTVQSLLLSELFSERREAILALGRDIGWHRVMQGKHFATDIYAGRVLGKAIVRQLHESAAFEHDFAEVKAEIRAAAESKSGRELVGAAH
jgi:acid phosphatase (class A)